jgi:GTP-binding protein
MIIRSAEFVKSSVRQDQLPRSGYPEYAFVGRSNVGKSSLINMLTSRKKLAKISSTPGKTKQVNHFLINSQWYLVDLPGYGYARVAKGEKKRWIRIIEEYILQRVSLACLFVLIDIRLDPQPIDLHFLTFLGIHQVPFVILFTKADKLSAHQQKTRIQRYKEELLKSWDSLPPCFLASAVTRAGKEEILDFIDNTNEEMSKR